MVCLASECERQWLGGSAGVCNNVTGLCDCPPGFSGRDVWQRFNSCHIRENVIAIVNLAFLLWTVFAVVVTFACVCYILIKYKQLESVVAVPPRRRGRSTLATFDRKLGGSTGMTGVREPSNKSGKFVRSRKKLMFLAVMMLFLYPFFSLPYAILNALEPPIYRYELAWVADVSTGISISLLYGAFWVVLFIIYKSFPNVNLISKLLNIQSPFITRPSLFRNVVVGHVAIEMFTVILTLGILPSVYFEDTSSRTLFSQLFVYLSIAFVLEFTTVFVGVCLVVRRLYRLANESLQDRAALLDISKVEKASKNITIMMVGVIVATLVGVVPFIAMLTPNGMRYYFVLYFVCAIGGYGLAILGCIILAREIQYTRSASSGVDKPRRRSATESHTIIHNI